MKTSLKIAFASLVSSFGLASCDVPTQTDDNYLNATTIREMMNGKYNFCYGFNEISRTCQSAGSVTLAANDQWQFQSVSIINTDHYGEIAIHRKLFNTTPNYLKDNAVCATLSSENFSNSISIHVSSNNKASIEGDNPVHLSRESREDYRRAFASAFGITDGQEMCEKYFILPREEGQPIKFRVDEFINGTYQQKAEPNILVVYHPGKENIPFLTPKNP